MTRDVDDDDDDDAMGTVGGANASDDGAGAPPAGVRGVRAR